MALNQARGAISADNEKQLIVLKRSSLTYKEMNLTKSPICVGIVLLIIVIRVRGSSVERITQPRLKISSVRSREIKNLPVEDLNIEGPLQIKAGIPSQKNIDPFKKSISAKQIISEEEQKLASKRLKEQMSILSGTKKLQEIQENDPNHQSIESNFMPKKDEPIDSDDPKKVCKVDVLKHFGMGRANFFEFAKRSNIDIKAYCRRNLYTCCSVDHIESLASIFQRATEKLRKLFEPIEELLTLFRGPVYKNFINDMRGDEICAGFIEESMVLNEQKTEYFFDPEHTKARNEEIFSLLVDLEYYIKHQIWFYGNMICTICNPDENKFFSMKSSKPRITALMNTCSDILEAYEFELRLAKLYNGFFKPLTDLISCREDNFNEGEVSLSYIPFDQIRSMERKFRSCYSNLSEKNADCVDICSKSLTTFSPNVDIHTPFKEALRIIFRKFTKKDIVDYYREIKQEEFEDVHLQSVYFFMSNWSRVNSQEAKNFAWKFSIQGANIYNNHISKKFYNYRTIDKR